MRRDWPAGDGADRDSGATSDVGVLARRHGRLVFATAYRLLGDTAAAEEVQQDVFVRLLDRPPREVANWPAFLTGAATRLAIDRLRKASRWRRLFAMFSRETTPHAAAADESAVERERAAQLRAAIARLPEREAHCFAMRYVEGLELADIATLTGLTTNHVGVVLHRATASIKARIGEEQA